MFYKCSTLFTKFPFDKKYFTPSIKLGAKFKFPCVLQRHFPLENESYILALQCKYLTKIPQIDEEMHQGEYVRRKKREWAVLAVVKSRKQGGNTMSESTHCYSL